MHAGTFRNTKLRSEFRIEWFEQIATQFPSTMTDNRRFMFLITLAFHGIALKETRHIIEG